MNDLISVIVPIYNVEKYLDRCIESIVNQTYKNLEIILVDDGSSDNCPKMCDKWAKKDNRIKVIHKENRGVSSARNTGINNVNGNYIVFVDSDDFLEDNALYLMTKRINNYDILICSNYNITNNKKNKNLFSDKEIGIYNLNSLIQHFFNNYNSFVLNVPWNKLYKTNIIKKYNLKFKEDIELGEDFMFNIDYFMYCNNILITNDIIYNYRFSDNGLARKKREIDYYWDNEKKINIYLISTLKKFDKYSQNESIINHFLIYKTRYIFYTICNLSEYTKMEKKKELKKICKSVIDFNIKINKLNSLKEKIWILLIRATSTNIIYNKLKER